MRLIQELKNTNNKIVSCLNNMNAKLGEEVFDDDFDPKLEFKYDSSDTSTKIYAVDRNMKSNIMTAHNMKRIICLKGKIIINNVETLDKIILEKTNTHLIIPETKFTIESMENSEYVCVDMNISNTINSKNVKVDSIYNK